MNNYRERFFQLFSLSLSVVLFSIATLAQQVQRAPFDVSSYQMDVQLLPDENKLNATVDVNFTPAEDTRTVSFELNGSLKIESVTRQNSFSATTQPKNKTVAATTAPCRARTDLGVFQFFDRSRLLEVWQNIRILRDPLAVERKGNLGHML